MSELSPEATELRKAQEAEYGAYVATEQIYVGGALAFNIGDPVPRSHVDRGIVEQEQVAKPSTKAGQQARATNPTSPTEKGDK